MGTAVAPAPAEAVKKRGDIVSEYKGLVASFLVLQLCSWTVGILQLFSALGAVGYELMSALSPLDISFCQMMFWGTMHYGPISDGRLSLVCRIAFLIEGAVFVTNSLTIYQPQSVAEAFQFNGTDVGEAFKELSTWSLFVHYFRAFLWFCVWIPFSAWIGTTALQVGRRRLLENVPAASLAPFSTIFLRVYVVIVGAQLLLTAWNVARTAASADEEALVFATKLNYAVTAFSMFLAQVPGWKAVMFDATGVTLADFRAGKAPCATYLAGMFTVLYFVVVVVDFALFAVATGSEDPVLRVHNVYSGLSMQNNLIFAVWLCAAYGFGLKPSHMIAFEKTEEKLRNRRKAPIAV